MDEAIQNRIATPTQHPINVLNYEGASRHFKLEGVNVLTGARQRPNK